ncbi:hypothetical protein J8281_12595 [Aquimarina sp. U1-2]|uniref:hypothetical protein n=1 Tax=Aquimarina sp. U1-2 TaxID=2823141 RepID=UPI001AEC7CCF|nr:hypothetical protein [Aquimarina sp. U1-2]MBP2833028.1 hypothetical protein [Aquimarina sp. U1-2]
MSKRTNYKANTRGLCSSQKNSTRRAGSVPLEHFTETTYRNSTAIEYNIVKLGTYDFSPQAGIAVYHWMDSKLTGARIYDDFEPPKAH